MNSIMYAIVMIVIVLAPIFFIGCCILVYKQSKTIDELEEEAINLSTERDQAREDRDKALQALAQNTIASFEANKEYLIKEGVKC